MSSIFGIGTYLTLLRTVFVSPSGEIGAISGRVIDFLEGSISAE